MSNNTVELSIDDQKTSQVVTAETAEKDIVSKADKSIQSVREHIAENHGGLGSDRIKSVVFGGLDGVITTFSIVSAVAGASLSIETALLMGFSNLIADGISMGLGDFLSSKA